MLPDSECAIIIQNYLLESLDMEDPTYLELEMLAKFINIEYELREDLCKLFNQALKKNIQNIAGISINAWLKRYLEKYLRIPREPDTFLRYSLNDPKIRKLNEKDIIRLMRIFRLYDYLLVSPVFSIEDVQAVNIMHSPMFLSRPLREIVNQVSLPASALSAFSQTITEKLPLRDLLKKYPAVGEQMVTANQLKLSHFDRPVRPSIRNWLYDYTSQLGQERHDSMQRMKYLFSSVNGKNLTSPDREKLGIILKSFDENVPLPVDAGRNEVVFDNLEVRGEKLEMRDTKLPAPSTQQVVPQQKTSQETFIKPYPKPEAKPPVQLSRQSANRPAENISNVRFNEGLPQKSLPRQNLPAQPQIKNAVPPKISFSRPRRNIIEPIGRRPRPEPKIEGNIVDLSEKDS